MEYQSKSVAIMVTYKSLLAVLGLLLIGVHSGNASTVEDQMRDLQWRFVLDF